MRVLNSGRMATAHADARARVLVRAARPVDIPVVRALADDIWRRHYPGIIPQPQIDYMLARGYSPEALSRFVTEDGAGLALADVASRPAGFAGWYRADATTTKLDKLYVLPECHGMGAGRALIEHVAAFARGRDCTALTLNVNRNNTGAIRAYERCGFAIRGRGDFPIGDGLVMEDFIMARAL
jgi:ribosomal protein S18 acetylase RimI-like enzyme